MFSVRNVNRYFLCRFMLNSIHTYRFEIIKCKRRWRRQQPWHQCVMSLSQSGNFSCLHILHFRSKFGGILSCEKRQWWIGHRETETREDVANRIGLAGVVHALKIPHRIVGCDFGFNAPNIAFIVFFTFFLPLCLSLYPVAIMLRFCCCCSLYLFRLFRCLCFCCSLLSVFN